MKSKKKNKIFTVLFVCSGNSCRSPMAAGLMQKKLFPQYGDQVKIHSAGTLGIEDNPATLHAIEVAKEKGVDISNHRSKGLRSDDVAEADFIFVLADHHKEYFDRYFPQYRENVFILKTFALGKDKLKNVSINDPIGQSLRIYRKTIDQIDKELNRILPQLRILIDNKLKEE